MTPSTPFHNYIIQCADESYYTGIARDPQKRLRMHISGKGAEYFRRKGKLPITKMVVVAIHDDMRDALSYEAYLKKLNKRRKSDMMGFVELGGVLTG